MMQNMMKAMMDKIKEITEGLPANFNMEEASVEDVVNYVMTQLGELGLP